MNPLTDIFVLLIQSDYAEEQFLAAVKTPTKS